MTEAPVTGADGRPLSSRGARTRRRLIEAAERVFAELGYHDASIVKLTEAAGVGQGTFYLYFASKKEIFDELVLDLNHRVRQAMTEAASRGETRAERELLGFTAFFGFTADHPAGRVRLAGDAPPTLRPADRGLCRGAPTGDGAA
jgi:AcrR family transcriptional regulator